MAILRRNQDFSLAYPTDLRLDLGIDDGLRKHGDLYEGIFGYHHKRGRRYRRPLKTVILWGPPLRKPTQMLLLSSTHYLGDECGH